MNKELEEAINRVKFNATYSQLTNGCCIVNKNDLEVLLKHIENSISKEKHKKLKEHCKTLIKEKQELTSALLDSIPREKVEKELQELLEGK